MFTLQGVLKVKNDEVVVSEKFKKREFVIIDESSQYPQEIAFQLAQDRTELLDGYNVGDSVNVYFNLRGREWVSPQGETKYFNTLDAWKMEAGQNEGDQQEASIAASAGVEHDDLPF